METNMQYKTIVLELLREHKELHEQLRRTRQLLPTLETFAQELKTSHEAWKEVLTQAKPDSEPSQIASEALEMALREVTERLALASPDENETLSLDEAMTSISRHTSRA
jgi:hypothetical protein